MNDIVSRNTLNWASFVIVITCLVVMVTKLQASGRFRFSNTLPDPPSHHAVVNKDDIHSDQTSISEQKDILPSDMNLPDAQIKSVKGKSLASDRGQHKVVATKETQVVRSVILVAVIFVTCQAPLMAYTLARRFESQFDDNDDMISGSGQKYIFLFGLCANINLTFALINASVNIVVY
ncbi:hypothetical protein RRG08_002225 [Elysia crispata]|uniref:Uncharacterized protein n=1 Tax=Elysia crispata TaxID=231223 RepID=A0AAE0ZAT7_9GAST|nr:hypothetical protein RRG08_002225 [Elysia crispata]